MPLINVMLREGFVSDYDPEDIIHIGGSEGAAIRITALERGMTSGKASVGIGIPMPDGKIILVESSLELFLGAAAVLGARFEEVEINRVQNQIRKLLQWFAGRAGDHIQNEVYQTLFIEFTNTLMEALTGASDPPFTTIDQVVEFMNETV